jgi:amidohydrolase
MQTIFQQAQAMFPYLQMLRRDLHQNPELGFREVRTAGVIKRELNRLGIEVRSEIAKTGVVALIKGKQPGPVVMIRVDMDALPILEDTGAVYASENPGVMHACGHDGHVAIGLGVAQLLCQLKDSWIGTAKLIFQPAEEGDGGAEQMISAGVLENPKPDFVLGIHVWNEKPVGNILVVPGPFMAGADIFTVKITGKGGHGAVPNLAIDPIVTASHVVTGLQTIVSRNIAPLESAVVSVTSFRSGEAFNVIPQVAELRGTIRTFDPGVRQRVIERFKRIVSNIAQSMDCVADIQIEITTPAVINNAEIAKKITGVIGQAVPGSLLVNNFQTMGSEDFAFLIRDIPGCYLMVGSANPAKGMVYGHHHPKFDFDETALVNGVSLMVSSTLKLLQS